MSTIEPSPLRRYVLIGILSTYLLRIYMEMQIMPPCPPTSYTANLPVTLEGPVSTAGTRYTTFSEITGYFPERCLAMRKCSVI